MSSDPDHVSDSTDPQSATADAALDRVRFWMCYWRKLVVVAGGGLLLVFLGVWVIVRDKERREVARVRLPEGRSVTQEPNPRRSDRESFSGNDSTPSKVALPKTTPDAVPPWNLPPGSPLPAISPFDAAKAKEHQEEWAKHVGVPVEFQNSIGVRFALIPPGEFDMGSTEADLARLLEEAKAQKMPDVRLKALRSEAPRHRVRITEPFYLGSSEVTQAEYERVLGSNPSRIKGDSSRPVETVSFDDASAFCRKLDELPQEQAAIAEYRLPTEAEWEYACRAGTVTSWYGTDDEAALPEQAWFRVNALATTHPARQKTPNAWGLYDMHGNVWEWCQDWFGDRYYSESPRDDPAGVSVGSYRVRRGGGWWCGASLCRASYRGDWVGPGLRDVALGFRLARSVSFAEITVGSAKTTADEAAQSQEPPMAKPPATAGVGCGGETLRWRFAKDERLHYRVATNAKSRMGAGESTQSLVLETTWLVVNVEQGLAEIAVTVDGIYFRSFLSEFGTLAEYSSLTRDATGRLREPARKLLAELLNALLGTPIMVRGDAKGKMVDVKFSEKWKDAFKGEAASELAGLYGYWISDPGMRGQLLLPMIELPDGTPAAGEAWTRQRDLVVWDVPETRAALSWVDQYRYEGDERRGAASLAKLAMTRTETLTVVKPRAREPFTQKITSQGTVLFDRAEGRTIECRLKHDGTTGDCKVTATLVNKE